MATLTVGDLTPRDQYTATAGETTFTYSFPIFNDSDLKVYIGSTLKTLSTDYTVTDAGSSSGGTVVFGSGLATGDVVTIWRDIPVQRSSDYSAGGSLKAETLNDDLDKLVMMTQQIEEMHESRTVMLAPMAEGSLTHIDGTVADRANKYLAFTANGDISYTPGTSSDIVPGQVGADLVSASTEQDGRDAIDVYSQSEADALLATKQNTLSIHDQDDMSADSNTSLATQQSIKAYADSQSNKIYATSGTYTVPVGVTKLMVTALGGGGGHAQDTQNVAFGSGGSGALFEGVVNVTAGDTLTITVGAIGTNTSGTGGGLHVGGAGGNTSVTGTSLNITADGGAGGRADYATHPGNATGGVVSSTTGSTGVHSAVQGGSGGHTDYYGTNEPSPPGGINPNSSGILYAYGQGGGSDEPVSPYNPGAGAYDATAGMVQIKFIELTS